METTRPCTVAESIEQSLKEMVRMKNGDSPKSSLSDLFKNIEKWTREGDKKDV